jgi:quinol-cytochrome oxidoreductase complex cytochrome b subunit
MIIKFEKVVDDATAFPVALILLLCFGFMCLNYGVFFPAEMNEYYLRTEAERIIQDRKRAEWKVADEWKKTVKELELQQMMQKLKEKKQHGG